MTERMVDGNEVRLWTESFGDPADDPVLLIMGAGGQGIYWPEVLIDRLTARNLFVIRYDNRDTGQSTCLDYATSPYTLDDLARDAVAVLDGYGLPSAHVVGASMGGMICQLLAINHRNRLRTMTLIMTSPLAGGGGEAPQLGVAGLPGPDEAWMAQPMALQAQTEDRAGQIEQRVRLFELLAGSAEPFDRDAQVALATREVDRAVNLAALNNHTFAIAASTPVDRRPLLAGLDIPTLVVHGTEDPILPNPTGRLWPTPLAVRR